MPRIRACMCKEQEDIRRIAHSDAELRVRLEWSGATAWLGRLAPRWVPAESSAAGRGREHGEPHDSEERVLEHLGAGASRAAQDGERAGPSCRVWLSSWGRLRFRIE